MLSNELRIGQRSKIQKQMNQYDTLGCFICRSFLRSNFWWYFQYQCYWWYGNNFLIQEMFYSIVITHFCLHFAVLLKAKLVWHHYFEWCGKSAFKNRLVICRIKLWLFSNKIWLFRTKEISCRIKLWLLSNKIWVWRINC